jgi:hypothetical protein
VDLLTPLIGKPKSSPIALPVLNAAATPLRYLDILLEDDVPAVIAYDQGIPVNVPSPITFTLHKYIIAAERPATERIKRQKDLKQVQALVEVLREGSEKELKNRIKQIAKKSNHLKKKMDSFQKEFL